MTLLPMPPTTNSFGEKVVVFLGTPPAAATGIPTLTEVNAALFGSLHLYTPFNVQPSQTTGEGPRKLGSKYTETENGTVNYPAVDISYSYMPQALGTPGAEGNELYELLEPGELFTVVILDGIDGQLAEVSTGDVSDIYLMRAGVRRKGDTDEGEFGKKNVMQSMTVVGGQPIAEDHPLAAA